MRLCRKEQLFLGGRERLCMAYQRDARNSTYVGLSSPRATAVGHIREAVTMAAVAARVTSRNARRVLHAKRLMERLGRSSRTMFCALAGFPFLSLISRN
jgi:hypothetical protein